MADNLADTLATMLADALADGFEGKIPDCIGVAVSGGGDSFALLDLLRRWSLRGQARICVVSVNHGLRAEAGDEIALVAEYARTHGLDHDILHWHWDGVGGVQMAAREARRALIREWAEGRGLAHVALGHTADDQAETVLMRLARGSGVDGLAAISRARVEAGLTWLRPLLSAPRADLRDYLCHRGLTWADDPSNEDLKYDRIKARKALETLSPLGLTVARLVQTAEHMARARDVLEATTDALVRDVVTQQGGDLVIAREGFLAAPQEIQLRLLARALGWVSGQVYRPRFRALTAVLKAERVHVLQGCLIVPARGGIHITRELAAVADARCGAGEVWDGRWQAFAPQTKNHYAEGLQIAALTAEGLAQIDNWRDVGVIRQTLLASPAIWHKDKLIAAPLAGFGAGWRVALLPHRAIFG